MLSIAYGLNLFDFSEDMVLDEEAFQQAVREFSELGERLKNLRNEIESMLDELKHGFDTPAGRKFMISCERSLLVPMKQQEIVLTHVSETLNLSISEYRAVFERYVELQNHINSVG